MLKITVSFKRGIMFVRLIGELTYKTKDVFIQEVSNVINNCHVKMVIYNFLSIRAIDEDGIELLLNEATKTKSFICEINDNVIRDKLRKYKLYDYMYEVSDEFTFINKFI